MAGTIRVTYIDNCVDGCVHPLEVPAGQDVRAFCVNRSIDPDEVLVRINRKPSGLGRILQEGDIISVSPIRVMA